MPTATLLNVAALRQHIESDLPDAAVQRLLDAEEAEIIARHGPHDEAIEERYARGEIMLYRRADSITSVEEYQADGSLLTLDEAGYQLAEDGFRLVFLPSVVWPYHVLITYEPRDTKDQRRLALIDLVRLDIQNTGRAEETVGDYRSKAADATERERILRRLAPAAGIRIA